jgi:hypothetical protein
LSVAHRANELSGLGGPIEPHRERRDGERRVEEDDGDVRIAERVPLGVVDRRAVGGGGAVGEVRRRAGEDVDVVGSTSLPIWLPFVEDPVSSQEMVVATLEATQWWAVRTALGAMSAPEQRTNWAPRIPHGVRSLT